MYAWCFGYLPRAIGYSLLALGAFSNVIDRFIYGGVIDYVQIWILPVFNVADVMIISGLSVIMISRNQ